MSSTPETTTIDNRPDNEKFPDVMVDLETTGIDKARCAILQIAGVKFNLQERTVGGFFNESLIIPPGRYWDEGTREWWLRDKRAILLDIMSKGRPHREVLAEFEVWANGSRRMWGKPSHFDFSFLEDYFLVYEINNPFHFYTTENMHSWIRSRYWPQQPPNWQNLLPFVGPAHNALYDCFHQLKMLFKTADDTTVSIKGLSEDYGLVG